MPDTLQEPNNSVLNARRPFVVELRIVSAETRELPCRGSYCCAGRVNCSWIVELALPISTLKTLPSET
jgi:hypothetical protein